MIRLFSLFLLSSSVFAKIDDNSFILEEAYNQRPGEFQFIQIYRSYKSGKEYRFISEGEMPLGSEKHQFSYQFARENGADEGSVGDTTLNYRIQSLNEPDLLMAHRFGLILPTGSVDKESSYGVTGLRYVQANTFILNDYWDNHWNLGINHYPEAKVKFSDKRRTLNEYGIGSSLIYHWKDNLNLLLEATYETLEELNLNSKKKFRNIFTLLPGVRTAIDLSWKETQIVPGLGFPVRFEDEDIDHGLFVYLSIEPKF
jgi:hypothetical protein